MQVHRQCPLCHSMAARELFLKQELRVVTCRECGMCYADPVDSRFVDSSYYDESGTPYYLSPDKLAADFSPVRYTREMKLFRTFCSGGKVLDVGCSTGGFLHHLSKNFPGVYETAGTDASLGALRCAEEHGVKPIYRPFLDPGFGEREEFDAITFWAVLEHVGDPAAFLAQAHRLLKPGGLCFVLVPNFSSLAVRVLGQKYRYILPQHLNYFSRNTLETLSRKEFNVLKITTSHFNPIVILQDFSSGQGMVPDEERARLLARTNHWKQSALSPLKVLYSVSEAIVARLSLADNLVAVLEKAR
jgi:2-polyprenyl-3-methyl-5-hydroxy-6-metoxy-1,4-benzoquinol methylase